uniref:IncH1 plasmid conjugative transfer pilin TrhA n=1 Tax=Klebsiella pneumoniae TaxID=573 RepID=A0A8B0SSK7_KLEPN|nr:IncH1 plasmid conjugative transfer pilin precursor TrhA [Klebsiella pneumoniae]
MIQKSMAMSGTTANYTLAESLRNMLSNKMFRYLLRCCALRCSHLLLWRAGMTEPWVKFGPNFQKL